MFGEDVHDLDTIVILVAFEGALKTERLVTSLTVDLQGLRVILTVDHGGILELSSSESHILYSKQLMFGEVFPLLVVVNAVLAEEPIAALAVANGLFSLAGITDGMQGHLHQLKNAEEVANIRGWWKVSRYLIPIFVW